MFGMERTFRHSAATVDTQPKKRKRRARKNPEFDGEELQHLPLPTPTARKMDPDDENRMEEYVDERGIDVVGPEGPLRLSTLQSFLNSRPLYIL